MTTDGLAHLGIALASLGLGLLGFVLAAQRPAAAPVLGLRGYRRFHTRTLSPGLRWIEPILRVVAAWMAHLPLDAWRQRADRRLWRAGDYMGLTPDEWLALCVLGGGAGLALGSWAVFTTGLPYVLALLVGFLMAWVPYAAVDDAAMRRRREINRALPGAIDLVGLCVSAGLGFPQALKEVTASMPDPRHPLVDEFNQILRQLDLGHGRAHVMRVFADRIPTEPVADFTGAVLQSEEKGTPLKEVLLTQAALLRARRSMLAEEAAAKASVRMTLPLALMLMTNFILIAGPLVLRSMEHGF